MLFVKFLNPILIAIGFLIFILNVNCFAQTNTHLPPSPYDSPGGKNLTINGLVLSRNMVFRFLPVTLPLANIRVTSLYGLRVNPFTHQGSEFHPGIDFGDPEGTPVYSTAAGIVSFVGVHGDYGNLVTIRHGLGFETRYSHLSGFNVRQDQVIDRNTIIGWVGNTGRSTAPHLYYEIWKDGIRMDPAAFILKAYELYHHLN